jgi:Amt family ammonium transporter
VVHAYAGIAGLAILLAIGPTLRRAPNNGNVRPELVYVENIEAQNINLPLAIIGTTLLWFGWYGFNGGSTITVTPQTGFALANTSIAAALGGLVTLLLSRVRLGLWSPVMAISGILGGLVAITPLAGFIDLNLALVVGALAGFVTFYGIRLVEHWYMIDDPVGSLPVHGFNGIMGSALVPVLADPSICGLTGLIYGGAWGWVAVQLMGMGIALLFVFSTTYGLFRLLVKLGFRVRVEEELAGLDVVDHGIYLG